LRERTRGDGDDVTSKGMARNSCCCASTAATARTHAKLPSVKRVATTSPRAIPVLDAAGCGGDGGSAGLHISVGTSSASSSARSNATPTKRSGSTTWCCGPTRMEKRETDGVSRTRLGAGAARLSAGSNDDGSASDAAAADASLGAAVSAAADGPLDNGCAALRLLRDKARRLRARSSSFASLASSSLCMASAFVLARRTTLRDVCSYSRKHTKRSMSSCVPRSI